MAAQYTEERVLTVHHWSDRLFSLTTTRSDGFRFQNGQFVMMGLQVDGKPLTRAYSMASANYDETLEFYSIKVPNGPLTSKLQHVKVGDTVLVGTKAVGTLHIHNLKPGKRLWLLGTGTGLAPFLSVVKDPEVWERFEKVIVVHGCRNVGDLSYAQFFENDLPNHEYFGEAARQKLIYFPTVTREAFRNCGRITDMVRDGRLAKIAGIDALTPAEDRVMICGSNEMIKETMHLFEERGFVEGDTHEQGDFLIEKAFVSK
ncbi:MAG: ferredoxin--NADP reductase [Archangium sp.]